MKKILLIEHNEEQINVIKQIFSEHFTTSSLLIARDEDVGFELLDGHELDLLLLNLHLPDSTSLHILENISHINLPMIIFTTDLESATAARHAGADECIVGDISSTILTALIRSMLIDF